MSIGSEGAWVEPNALQEILRVIDSLTDAAAVRVLDYADAYLKARQGRVVPLTAPAAVPIMAAE